jgi:hypothetical protein
MAEDKIKIYEPNEIEDISIYPVVDETGSTDSTSDSTGVESPSTLPPTSMPNYILASDLINASLDTQMRKIKSDYGFTETGSIQIGKYAATVSGQILISPDGIVAISKDDGLPSITIDGQTGNATFKGTILAGSVVTGYLTVGGAAADVNANATGISADRVSISGSTSFTSGYDPTTKVASTGGNYTTTATAAAAKVKIFPDANTGIIAYASDGTTVIFKVEVGGTNVGDITLGNYAGGTGMLWDQSAGKLYIKGDMTAGTIDGVAITGGSLTGATIKTAASGARVELTAAGQSVNIYDSGGHLCGRLDDAGGYIILEGLDSRDVTIKADGGQIYLDDEVHIASAIDLVFDGTQGSINCGSIDCNAITMNGQALSSVGSISMGGSIDLNNNNLDDVATIDGGGDDVRFDDSVNMNNKNINHTHAINVDYIDVDDNDQVQVNDDLYVNGALSKNSGTFDIPHPDPSKKEYRLRHSLVEAPTAGENMYRYEVDIVGGKAEIDLPDYFKYLNENPQVWLSPVDVFGIAKATCTLKKIVIETDTDGKYNVLVIGTRKDPLGIKHWNRYGLEYIGSERFIDTIGNRRELKEQVDKSGK